ncbi:MAG: flippase-like domain-containing protein [Planctomycetaceae bacterium]|nr:flippase-like domain-containing protein [Planctomycetales bacterium]MCB9927556.1 flippase-like domain-containing protein [Planctomycetaceae bacterium]
MTSDARGQGARTKGRIKFVVRMLILTLVAWGVWRTFVNARGEFAKEGIDWQALRFDWLCLAMLFYLIGMFPSCIFWWQTLRAMGQQPTLGETVRAFYIGHLGKYVPGKALVVVIRTGLIRSNRVDTTVAAASVFVETLTLMSVGAVIAALLLGTILRSDPGFVLLAIALAIGAGVPTYPPFFRQALRLLQVHRANPDIERALDGLDARLMVTGWALISTGCLFFGLSLWATAKAIPGEHTLPALSDLPLLVATVSLAMVAGFLSLLPGGMGVRELVMIPLLRPHFGQVVAIAAAVLLRVCWMAAELMIAGILYFAGSRPKELDRTSAESSLSTR